MSTDHTQAFYRRIIDNLSATVLMFNEHLALDYLNPAGEMLFAISARRLRGISCQELFPGNAGLCDLLREALRTNHPFTDRELRLGLPDGRAITVDCTVTPFIEPPLPRAVLVEIQHIDRHLRISRDESLLSQHHAAQNMLRGLAHEIKNPLGGLRGAAQLLERELPDDGLREYTRVIISEADRLRNLVNRLLGPHVLPHKRLVNIHEVLERVRSLAVAEAPPSIVIHREYDPSLPDIHADPDQLIQATLNIVRNAVEALNGKGEITLRTRPLRQFTIGQTRHKLVVCVEIADNGPGIAPEMIDQIFYPMVTGRADGTGLGLSIAQALINQHQGLIECTSRPGRTVFTILLPLEPQPRDETRV